MAYTLGYAVYTWDETRIYAPDHCRWLIWAECEALPDANWQAYLANREGYRTMIRREPIYL